MYSVILAILVSGLISTTAWGVIDTRKESPAMGPQPLQQERALHDPAERLKHIHNYNEVFDNYHAGSSPHTGNRPHEFTHTPTIKEKSK